MVFAAEGIGPLRGCNHHGTVPGDISEGMTGSLDSIIGMKREPIISKFYNGIHQKFEVAKDNPILDMTLVDIEPKSGRTTNIEAYRYYEATYGQQLA